VEEDVEGGGTTGSAIYKKNAASEPAMVDTVGAVAETEMVKLNDAQPDTDAAADAVSSTRGCILSEHSARTMRLFYTFFLRSH